MSIARHPLAARWARHHAAWRDPVQVAVQWREATETDPRALRYTVSGEWWETLAVSGATFLVTREYEHVVMALRADEQGPVVTYLPLPHPSGLAVDRARGIVHLASTRNPNQVYDLRPVSGVMGRADVRGPQPKERPLLPTRARYYPGCLYLHDLAMIGGRLHGTAAGQNAVVRLDKPPANLVVARLGDSDKLEVGEWVVAVGSPLGLEQTVTAGIVSGKGRPGRHVQMSGKRVRGYIQTDAKINPGNSGGPLVNLEGEVVGVNTLIQVGAGGAYGFAIPVNEVRRVAQVLVKEGHVRYPYLGLLLTDVKDLDDAQKAKLGKTAPPRGAFVQELTPGGPAGKAGMRPGDVITEVNNQKINGAGDVVDYVSGQNIGTKVTLHYVREGKPAQTQVALAELPDEDQRQTAEAQGQGKIGLGLQTLTPDVANSLGLERGTRGAVVTDVVSGSPAERAGIKPGDVIVEVDRQAITSSDDAVAALHAPPKSGGHLLRVRGANGTRFVTIK